MTYYNPKIHHRRSIRLKNYDYSQAGLYFITICCQDRVCRFGDVIDGKMILNDAGRMIEKWYYELENKYNDIRCHEMVVMPNHFHCIVENVGFVVVGADLRVCPYNNKSERGGRVVDENGIGDENGTLIGRGGLNENGTRIGGERGERVVDENGIGDENGTLNGRGALNENGTRIGGERGERVVD
ncbi:MAG: hypothetical protein H3C31_06175, partial [Brumimicrobium sp.]|nr:hypothetical protein [Brumimicrobium sp.]